MAQKECLEMRHLSIELLREGNLALYQFRGAIDECFRFKDIPVASEPSILFDLKGIRSLNSCGVREWVYFVRQFEKCPDFQFLDVAVVFVDQLNTVPQMLGRARVTSFFAPFYCPQCEEEVNERLVCVDHRDCLLAKQAPVVLHERCGKPLDFDALEESYFHQVERFLG